MLPFLLTLCAQGVLAVPPSSAESETGRFPSVAIINVFAPKGESNVRSSFALGHGAGLIGTEETGDIFRTTDAGSTWEKVCDGEERWSIMDVRNFIRGANGHLFATTSEPALVLRSTDEGKSWELVAAAKASRTVGLVQLESGTFLVGLRRALNNKISLVRSTDYFDSTAWVPVDLEAPRQNVTCFGHWGGETVLAGIGYEASGKIYKSTDDGLTWRRTGEFPYARDLMGFFKVGEDIYALASGIATLYHSRDDGESWTKSHQFWETGFVGACATYERDGKSYWLMAATDQTRKPYRHLILISENPSGEWFEWIELIRDDSGGASNLCILDSDTILVGTGNHSAQGRAFTLRVGD